VQTHVQITRVRFRRPNVRSGVAGVQIRAAGGIRCPAGGDLCAGTYGSPQLLMLSGIGRPDELPRWYRRWPSARRWRNLSDHPVSAVAASLRGPMGCSRDERSRTGPLGPPPGPLTSKMSRGRGVIAPRRRVCQPYFHVAAPG